jgi:hypothetical protein
VGTMNSQSQSPPPPPPPPKERIQQPQTVVGIYHSPLPSSPPMLAPTSPSQTPIRPPMHSREPTSTTKKSKLSALASSRASTISQSSRSFTLDDASVATYPALRPSPQSVVSLKSKAGSEYPPPSETSSATSSLVRRAIETAIKEEGKADDTKNRGVEKDSSSVSSLSSASTIKVSPKSQPHSPLTPTSTTTAGSKGPSKLALLAQAKAAQVQAQGQHFMPSPKRRTPSSSSPTAIQPLKGTHTEYLTPIANGSSATTAITTSYQSLNNLIPPSRSVPTTMTPMNPAALANPSPVTGTKLSKLASKSRKVLETQEEPPPPPPEAPVQLPPELPIFFPKSPRSRASPSAFASLLVDDTDPAKGASGVSRQSSRRDRDSKSTAGTGKSSSRRRLYPPPPEHILSSPTFTFDSPSPDDIVFNARKGTSLAQQMPRDAHAKSSTPPSVPRTSIRSSVPKVAAVKGA